MAIRDADMYGYNWAKCTHETSEMLSSGFQCHRIQVAGNRGTGGIDGLLSTAVGFGVGCNKHVSSLALICISFPRFHFLISDSSFFP